MGDDGRRIKEPRFKEGPHLVPRLEHFASHDAVDCEPFEDQVVGDLDGHFLLGDAQELHSTARSRALQCLSDGVRMSGHFTYDIDARRMRLIHHTLHQVFLDYIDTDMRAHFSREFETAGDEVGCEDAGRSCGVCDADCEASNGSTA